MIPQYLEDIPATDPQFDCRTVATALATVLLRPSKGAVVLGLHAPWGGGKTTLLRAIRERIETQLGENGVYIEFNAWKFQDREVLWRALILHVLEQLKTGGAGEKEIKELQQALYRTFSVEEKGPWKVDWRGVILEIIKLALSLVKLDFVGEALKKSTGWVGRLFLSGKKKDDKGGEEPVLDKERVEKFASFLERETVERQVLQIESIEQFLDEFRALIDKLRSGPDPTQDRQVFVFIDDLDRCLPESALTIFESIKLFLDSNGCRYIVALDRDVIRKGLDMRYSRAGEAAAGQIFIDPDQYIEKTISISYDLPVFSKNDMIGLIDSFVLPATLDDQHKRLLVDGLGRNPRRIIRFMNSLAVQMQLAELRSAHAIVHPANARDLDLFLKIEMIRYRYSGLFARVLEDPVILYRLQRTANEYRNTKDQGADAARVARKAKLEGEPRPALLLAGDEEFWTLMTLGPQIPETAEAIGLVTGWFRADPEEPVLPSAVG